MEKTITYKNIQNLIKKSENEQISFNEYLTGRFCHKKFGWTNFKLKEDFDFKGHLSKLFGRIKPDQILDKSLLGNYGIFNRIIIKKQEIDYCCGQEWDGECRTIRRLLKTRK